MNCRRGKATKSRFCKGNFRDLFMDDSSEDERPAKRVRAFLLVHRSSLNREMKKQEMQVSEDVSESYEDECGC